MALGGVDEGYGGCSISRVGVGGGEAVSPCGTAIPLDGDLGGRHLGGGNQLRSLIPGGGVAQADANLTEALKVGKVQKG